MRRILSACLEQTMRFDTTKDADPERDFKAYCKKLEGGGTKYLVEDTQKEADGSYVVKIKKQYNSYNTDGYLA